jgi:hypothetical protein
MFFIIGKPKALSNIKASYVPPIKSDRSNSKIVIIDDEDFKYLDTLRSHDFNVTHLRDIEDFKAVAEYHIVLCDIKGVGKTFKSKFEGAHVIGEIRKLYPFKVIIAYTGHLFDPTFNKYFQVSDYVLKKDIDSEEWVEYLDRAINKAIDPIEQWGRIRKYLLEKDVSIINILLLEDSYVRSILQRTNLFPDDKVMKTLSSDVKDVLKEFTAHVLAYLIAH